MFARCASTDRRILSVSGSGIYTLRQPNHGAPRRGSAVGRLPRPAADGRSSVGACITRPQATTARPYIVGAKSAIVPAAWTPSAPLPCPFSSCKHWGIAGPLLGDRRSVTRGCHGNRGTKPKPGASGFGADKNPARRGGALREHSPLRRGMHCIFTRPVVQWCHQF